MRLCLDCRRVTRSGSRCRACAAGTPTDRARRFDREHRLEAVRQWLAAEGPWCPGWRCLRHQVSAGDLTADHDPPGVPVTHWSQLGILCRSCNSRKKDS